MTLINTKLYTLAKVLFAEGWFFFVPYLFFYLLFKYFNLKIFALKNYFTLENIFTILHILNSSLLIYYLCKSYKKQYLSRLLFGFFLLLLFQIPGAYIEFPSDAWEHFRRIFEWQVCTFVDDHSNNHKFIYFWGWTLMSKVAPLYRRTALDIYSTFWQFILAYQFYLFAKRIGFSESWAKVQVLGTICLFGTNVFGFYRYYALSSTPLAYIAYLQSLTVILDILDGNRKKAILLLALIPMIYYNHYQELLLLIISGLSIFLANTYDKEQDKWINKIKSVIIMILIISFTIGTLSISFSQNNAFLIGDFWNVYLQNYFKEKTAQYLTIEANYWSKWGILRIWDQKLPYFQTLGVYGSFTMVICLVLWNKYRLLSSLTLFPFLLLFFQPLMLLISITDGTYSTFRILYAFPYSFMLIVGLKELFNFAIKKILGNRPIRSIYKYLIFIYFLIFLSFQPSFPWRGRLWHQLYKPTPQLSLEKLDITGQWLVENRQFDSPCLLITDNATSFSLATHLGIIGLIQTNRLSPYNPSQIIDGVDSLKNYIQSTTQHQQKLCKFLVGIPSRINPPPISKVGELSGHWSPELVRQDFNYTKEFVEATAFLTSLGWTKTFVPPFYWLYEAPYSETLR